MLWDLSYAIENAIFIFPILALILTLPFLIYQYNKYGATHWWRAITIYSFVFYMLVALFLVVLPLPKRSVVAQMTSSYKQLELFNFLKHFRSQGLTHGGLTAWKAFLQTTAFQQVFFNVLLTVPFGVYMRYYFKKSLIMTLVLTFCLSLSFELLQLSALLGIYPRPYRIFDVDDLFLNTLGGVVGYVLTPMIVFLFPTRNEIDTDALNRSEEVPFSKRLISLVIDGGVMGIISLGIIKVLRPDIQLLQSFKNPLRFLRIVFVDSRLVVTILLVSLLTMILVMWITQGYTIGKYLVKIRLESLHGNKIEIWQAITRYSVIALIVGVLYATAVYVFGVISVTESSLNELLIAVFLLLSMGSYLIIGVLSSFINNTQFISDKLARLTHISTFNED